MKILLVEPKNYHTRYPPLGLLKIAALEKAHGNEVELVKGWPYIGPRPGQIYITSLFTYAWEPVHDAVRYYRALFPRANIRLGGIYASLMSEHIADTKLPVDEVHRGVIEEAEELLPDYSWVPDWNRKAKASIVFSQRGCIRKCPYCAVPIIEPSVTARKSITQLVDIERGHRKVILWDNNILASPFRQDIFEELQALGSELGIEVDFNQGLDARLITGQVAASLRKLRMRFVRMAYDVSGVRKAVGRAIQHLKEAGFQGRRIIVYVLYNYKDSPEGFLGRVRDLLEWGVVAYPMRYEPINSLRKNSFVSRTWSPMQLEMVAKARRVIGFAGTFPPYDGLRKKLTNARSFEEAFKLRPAKESHTKLSFAHGTEVSVKSFLQNPQSA